MPAQVHKLVYATAVQMAGAVYDEMALDNAFYKFNKDPYKFIEDNWSSFIVQARETLAGMLAGSYPESQKAEIYEALILDASLPNEHLKDQIKLH